MRSVFLVLFIATAAGQLSLREKAPDTLELCVGANCTTAAFLPGILRTSFYLKRTACSATIAVAYECGRAPVTEVCHVTHTVSDRSPCIDPGGPLVG